MTACVPVCPWYVVRWPAVSAPDHSRERTPRAGLGRIRELAGADAAGHLELRQVIRYTFPPLRKKARFPASLTIPGGSPQTRSLAAGAGRPFSRPRDTS